jgi:hypothetical protein
MAEQAKSFGFDSTTDEVLEGIDLSGQLVTGLKAGLGVETPASFPADTPLHRRLR